MTQLTDIKADAEIQRLLLAHYRDIHNYVTRRLPLKLQPWVDSTDVVQDVCIEAIRSFERFAPADPKHWLLGIARIRLLELARRHRTLKRGAGKLIGEDALSSDDRETVIMLQDLVIYRKTPSASAIRHELIFALEKALRSVSESHRAVVRMRYLDGMSAAQAASKMGLSEDAIRQLAKRALAAIRSELRSYVPSLQWTT